MKNAIVDANILMANDSLIEYNKIFVPYTVILELDKLKFSKDVDKSRRATRAIKRVAGDTERFIPMYRKADYYYDGDISLLDEIEESGAVDSVFVTYDYGCYLMALSRKIECEFKPVKKEGILYNKIINGDTTPFGNYFFKKSDKGILFGFRADSTPLYPTTFDSVYTGRITSLDPYQHVAADMLKTKNLCVITGKAGSGKTLLTLSYACQEIEKRETKLYIFANPVPTLGARTFGYCPGDMYDKILSTSVGGILNSKIGSQSIDRLIDTGLLEILPFSELRGFDTGKEDAIVWIPEAQNISVELARLAIQRAGERTKIIFDGDIETQIDSKYFEGDYSGMKRVIEVFNTEPYFGCVKLENIYRSQWAAKAEEM